MQFEIEELSPVTVVSVNCRSELHGTEHVPAVDVGLKFTSANDVLTMLDGPLKSMFYGKPDPATRGAQEELEGVEPMSDMPKLRSTQLKPIKLKNAFAGYTLTVELGLGSFTIEGCNLDKFEADCLEGGTVELTFRLQAANLVEETIGRLAVLIGSEVRLSLIAPRQEALAA